MSNEFEMGGSPAQKGLWKLARKMQDRSALPKEEGDIVKEYQAMHEQNLFLQLAEGGCGR